MALEPNFRYLDDLVPTNPADNDPVEEGDDHLRGIKAALAANVTGDAAETRLLVGGAEYLIKNATELISRAPGGGNNVFRLQDDDGVTNRLNLFRNGGATTPISQLRVQTPGESFNLEVRDSLDTENLKQVRVTPLAVALGYAGADAALTSAQGLSAYAQAGEAAVVAAVASDEQPAEFVAINNEGSLGLRADANGFQGLLADEAQQNSEQFFSAKRLGESWMGYAGSQRITATDPGATVAGIATANGVVLDGDPDGDVELDNVTGDLVISNAGVVGIKSVDGEGFEAWRGGNLVLKALANGLRALATNANPIVELHRNGALRGSLLGTNADLQLISEGDLALYRATSELAILANATQTALQTGGVARLSALAAAAGNSFGSVRDASNTARPVGWNTQPTRTISGAGTEFDLADTDCGFKIRFNAVDQVCTIVDGLQNDFVCDFWNDSSGDCTIAEGVGISLDWFSGAGKVAGTFTLPSGSAARLTRRGSSTQWWVK